MRRAGCAAAALLLAASASSRAAEPAYAVAATLPLGAPDRWGYVKADPAAPRLYAAHGDRFTVIDTAAMAVVGELRVGPGAHAVAVLPKTGHGYASGGTANAVTVFDLATLAPVKTIDTAEDPDEMVAEPEAGRVWVVNDHGQRVQRIDAATDAVTATIEIGDKLESATTDGRGRLFVDGATKHEVVVIDTARAEVTARWPVPDCTSLHGIDYDAASGRLFASCVNGVLYALDAADGRVLQKVAVGLGGDVVTVDAASRRVLASNADGALSVFAISGTGELSPRADVPTPPGARTMALEPGAGAAARVFLIAAEHTDAAPTPSSNGGAPRFAVQPGTVHLLVLAPAG